MVDNLIRNWVGLFLMGAINNLPYVIVNSAASNIAESFDEKNLVGVVFGANVALSVVVKSLNAFVLLNVSYKIRYIANGCLMLIGLFGVAYALNFGFAIACIAIVGASAAFGENVTLGYLSWFPSLMVNAWSSGTGMAGVLGSTIYIIFGCTVGHGSGKTKQLHNLTKTAFLLTSPVVLVYWLAYFVVVKRPERPQAARVQDPPEQLHRPGDPSVMEDEDGLYAINIVDDAAPLIDKAATRTEESMGRRILRCLRLILWLGINLCLVYIFEYVARGCAAKVRPTREYNVGCPELYAALQLCYQAGVFVSRSSVQMFRIRRVEILTVFQLVNMILWIVDVHYKFLPVACLPALMIFVGLLGGASYVNIFYSLIHDEEFAQEDRELCVNLVGLFINLGIVAGTGLETVLFTTILKHD
ncbi:hypothetical protein RRG08_048884 [Elysia crispata]|uniref:Battenin n=1 Tax=Elysia crispata TaxID=231223 RepID=A0AAE1D554_9GAST|nr:hypothetical protein RRG08_048884 [Elysia crispata]